MSSELTPFSLVVDASVVAATLIDDGQEGRWAEAVLVRYNLLAPQVLLSDVTRVLRALEIRERIYGLEAGTALRDLVRLPIELCPFEPLAERIWELRRLVPSHRAWYIALAEALEVPLATLEVRLARETGIRCELLLPS